VPDNIKLLELPPYSPELNPVERIWHYTTQPLARQLGVSQPGGYYGCQRDGLQTGLPTITAWSAHLCAVAWAPAPPAL